MNPDFEEYLRRQSIRPVPAEWREEILRAAMAPQERRPTKPAAAPWWREWLWPCPRAWAGLAAAWGIILLLNVTAPDDPSAPARAASVSWQDFAFLRQETEMIAHLSDPEEYHSAPPPEPPALKPRSSRNVKKPDRYDSVGLGMASATVSVALAGVSPASRAATEQSPFDKVSDRAKVFGETPKTASETLALPETSALSQLIC
jgi:hypothetical protein